LFCFPPLYSGAKSSDADGEFLVFSGAGRGHMINFFYCTEFKFLGSKPGSKLCRRTSLQRISF